MNAKTFIFNHFAHIPMVNFMSFLTPKNLRFMTDFCSSQFVNNSQRFCLRFCQTPHPHFFLFPLAFLIHSLPLNSLPRRSPHLRAKTGQPRRSAAKWGLPSVGLAKEGQLTRLPSLFASPNQASINLNQAESSLPAKKNHHAKTPQKLSIYWVNPQKNTPLHVKKHANFVHKTTNNTPQLSTHHCVLF